MYAVKINGELFGAYINYSEAAFLADGYNSSEPVDERADVIEVAEVELCEIDGNNGRVKIVWDGDSLGLYAVLSDGSRECVASRMNESYLDALDECYCRWGVDPVGVWNLVWL